MSGAARSGVSFSNLNRPLLSPRAHTSLSAAAPLRPRANAGVIITSGRCGPTVRSDLNTGYLGTRALPDISTNRSVCAPVKEVTLCQRNSQFLNILPSATHNNFSKGSNDSAEKKKRKRQTLISLLRTPNVSRYRAHMESCLHCNVPLLSCALR